MIGWGGGHEAVGSFPEISQFKFLGGRAWLEGAGHCSCNLEGCISSQPPLPSLVTDFIKITVFAPPTLPWLPFCTTASPPWTKPVKPWSDLNLSSFKLKVSVILFQQQKNGYYTWKYIGSFLPDTSLLKQRRIMNLIFKNKRKLDLLSSLFPQWQIKLFLEIKCFNIALFSWSNC